MLSATERQELMKSIDVTDCGIQCMRNRKTAGNAYICIREFPAWRW